MTARIDTHEEREVAVTEARHRDTYVAAHAYSPDSIAQAVNSGVHTIEHSNLIDEPTAALMASDGAVLVPTLATCHAMQTVGADLGLPEKNCRKNAVVFDAELASLEIARRAGVTMAYGTDLIGETQTMQNREIAIRSEVLPRRRSSTRCGVPPRACADWRGGLAWSGRAAYGDLVVSRVDPLNDLVAFAEHEASISHVIQSGRPVVER